MAFGFGNMETVGNHDKNSSSVVVIIENRKNI